VLAVVGLAPTAGLLPVSVGLRVAIAIAFVLAMIAVSGRYGEEIEQGLAWFDARLGRKHSAPRRLDPGRKFLKISVVCTVLAAVSSFVLAVSIGPPTGLPGDSGETNLVDRSKLSHPSGLEASLTVANVTAGDGDYRASTLAQVDQVVKGQLSVKNTNDDGLPLTGVRVALGLPQKTGKAQNLNATVSASGNIRLTPAARVELTIDSARLRYIPGSLKLRSNASGPGEAASFVTEPVDDAILFQENLPMGDLPPGGDGAFSVTFLMRSVATAVTIRSQVRELPDGDWSAESKSYPGALIQYRIEVENKGNEPLRETLIHANLPSDVAYVPDSTEAVVGGVLQSAKDGIVDFSSPSRASRGRGAQFGDVPVGESITVYFDAKVAPSAPVDRTLIAVLVVRPAGANEFYNTAHLTLREPE